MFSQWLNFACYLPTNNFSRLHVSSAVAVQLAERFRKSGGFSSMVCRSCDSEDQVFLTFSRGKIVLTKDVPYDARSLKK